MANTAKDRFLVTYDREHDRTMRVLRAYPQDKLDLQPHPRIKTARELAWVFVLERYLGKKVWSDEFAKAGPSGSPPKPPAEWDEILRRADESAAEFRDLIAKASDAELDEKVHFFTGPKTMGEITRLDWAWFLLHDEIHHRGQFTIYLRMAEGKLPSVYGPTADEPWI